MGCAWDVLHAAFLEWESPLERGRPALTSLLRRCGRRPLARQHALFEQRLAEAREREKRCTGLVGAAGGVLGETPPAAGEVAAAVAARQEGLERHRRSREVAAMDRWVRAVPGEGGVCQGRDRGVYQGRDRGLERGRL